MSRTFKRIVVATSLSEASDDVVRAGNVIARATGATVGLFHAYAPPVNLLIVPPEESRGQEVRSRAEEDVASAAGSIAASETPALAV